MATSFKNVVDRATSTLASDILIDADTFTFATGEGALFPSSNFVVTFGSPGASGEYPGDYEQILVGSRTADVCSSCTRSYGGTTAVAWGAATPIKLNLVSVQITDIHTAINNVEKGIAACSAAQNIVAGDGITTAMLAYGTILVAGDGGAVDITANPQIAAGTQGQRIKIIGTNDTNTVKFDNGTGLVLLAPGLSITLGLNDFIIFQYITGQGWIEELSGSV